MKIQGYAVDWDTDGQSVDPPSSAVIELEEDEELVNMEGADALSDRFGRLVNHYNWRVSE